MKTKTLLASAFIAFAFYACNDDDSDKTHYLDNKLIEGTWIELSGKDSAVYTIKDNKIIFDFYAYISGEPKLKYEGREDYGSYQLTDSLILMSQPIGHRFIYKFGQTKDSLYIQNPINEIEYWDRLKKIKE